MISLTFGSATTQTEVKMARIEGSRLREPMIRAPVFKEQQKQQLDRIGMVKRSENQKEMVTEGEREEMCQVCWPANVCAAINNLFHICVQPSALSVESLLIC